MHKKYLFVCGVGRSGTTELARVLSTHPKIVLGVERYKRLWRPESISRLTPEYFEKDRFFDFSRKLTNITPDKNLQWKRHYEEMASKFDDAVYFGDKMTQLRVRELRTAFPEAKFIIIIRNIFDVAHSWDRRAKNITDLWPDSHDARQAVPVWNKALQDLSGYLRDFPDSVIHVEHHAFFSGTGHQLDRLLRFLELRRDADLVRRFRLATSAYLNRIARKDRTLDPATRDYIGETADMALWQLLCSEEKFAGSGEGRNGNIPSERP